MRNYSEDKSKCSFYERISDEQRRSFEVCNHPTAEFGYFRKTRVITAIGKKCCNHGDYKTESSEIVCSFIITPQEPEQTDLQSTLTEFIGE